MHNMETANSCSVVMFVTYRKVFLWGVGVEGLLMVTYYKPITIVLIAARPMLSYTTSYYNLTFSNGQIRFHINFLTINNGTKPFFLGNYNSYTFIKINNTYIYIFFLFRVSENGSLVQWKCRRAASCPRASFC